MTAATTSKFDAMTPEDRALYSRWARWVIGIYGAAFLALSVGIFVAPINH
jgi:hypothetical protein